MLHNLKVNHQTPLFCNLETEVGLEPTMMNLQSIALPSWLFSHQEVEVGVEPTIT
jgi:hypothetical protein